jgi:hypothetical protein
MFITVFKYLFIAVVLAIGSAFVIEAWRGGSARAGAKAVVTIFSTSN